MLNCCFMLLYHCLFLERGKVTIWDKINHRLIEHSKLKGTHRPPHSFAKDHTKFKLRGLWSKYFLNSSQLCAMTTALGKPVPVLKWKETVTKQLCGHLATGEICSLDSIKISLRLGSTSLSRWNLPAIINAVPNLPLPGSLFSLCFIMPDRQEDICKKWRRTMLKQLVLFILWSDLCKCEKSVQ